VSRTLRAWFAACCLIAAVSAALAQERILEYAIEVDVGTNGGIEVVEEITVRAEGNQIRRGIYRDFPTRYRDRYGNNVVVGFEVQGVLRDGAVEAWFTEPRQNGVRVNTGGDDLLPRLPAEYRYTLRYRTTRQIGFFAEHDELYWNAIGTGWSFPIERGRVEVRLPEAVPVELMTAEGYTGLQGAQGRAYAASVPAPGVARWELTAPLGPREGFTIALSFPKGVVAEPTRGERARWLFADNRGLLAALAGLALLVTYVVRRWRQVGRDPHAGVIIARYEPPEGRSPAELRYLKQRRYDTRCFTSDLLTAAVDGAVRVEREERFLLGDRWQLERSAGAAAGKFQSVTTLLERLFPQGAGALELTKKNAARLTGAHQAHARILNKRLHGSHFKRNVGSVVAAALIGVGTALVSFALSGGGTPPIIGVAALMALVVAVFGWLVQAPTPEGRKLLDETEGLRLYLSVAERDELKRMQGPAEPAPLDADRYQTLLPYAVALDVEEAWARKFTAAVGAAAAAEATARMAWYHGARPGDLGGLAKAVGSGLSSSIASASTPPGSSSGGGGGGSAGGGGGGGGGGGR
jgi:uncharacterized membrane protein YgcG